MKKIPKTYKRLTKCPRFETSEIEQNKIKYVRCSACPFSKNKGLACKLNPGI